MVNKSISIKKLENGYVATEAKKDGKFFAKKRLKDMIKHIEEVISSWDVEEVDEEKEE